MRFRFCRFDYYSEEVMIKKEFTVAVVGCGIVGGGTAKILTEQAELLKKRTGVGFRLKYVCAPANWGFPNRSS